MKKYWIILDLDVKFESKDIYSMKYIYCENRLRKYIVFFVYILNLAHNFFYKSTSRTRIERKRNHSKVITFFLVNFFITRQRQEHIYRHHFYFLFVFLVHNFIYSAQNFAL